MLSDESTQWHLTPGGWKEGSTKIDFAGRTHVPRPADGVLTVTYRERVASVFSRSGERAHSEDGRSDDAARVAQLLAQFGSCPASL